MIEVRAREDVDPICPHCDKGLKEVWTRRLSGGAGKRTVARTRERVADVLARLGLHPARPVETTRGEIETGYKVSVNGLFEQRRA